MTLNPSPGALHRPLPQGERYIGECALQIFGPTQESWSFTCAYWLSAAELPLSLKGESLKDWQRVCEIYQNLREKNHGKPLSDEGFQEYLTQNFTAVKAESPGLLTGYFHPILKASKIPSDKYPYPIYQRPKDLILIEDAGRLHPKAAGVRIGGRLKDGTLISYDSRADIMGGSLEEKGLELAYVNCPIDLFFAHIQGSARLNFEDGTAYSIYYDGTNGYPYGAIGKYLVDKGEIPLKSCTMDAIKNWLRNNPTRQMEVFSHNRSFVFFQKSPMPQGPLGALKTPLIPQASLAVDPLYIPLGSLVCVETSDPLDQKPLQSMMVASDVGGAIKGPARGDYYWGVGDEHGQKAGSMNGPAIFTVYIPNF